MNEFTKDERARIDMLYGNDFKGATPDDIKLIARFERFMAKQDIEHNEYIGMIKAESEQRVKLAKEQKTQAMKNMQALHDAAIARLEILENGI